MYGFVLWLPSIIRSGGENLGMVEVGWLSSVPYLAATIAMIIVSWPEDVDPRVVGPEMGRGGSPADSPHPVFFPAAADN